MPEATSTVILRSQPGIKRDGTKFDGEFYTDGQWVRFQRGLPRKIGGYRVVANYLTEVSRGFSTFTQQSLVYCHSGGSTTLERFYIDSSANSSLLLDRTPVAVAATGTVTLTGGAAGSVSSIKVNDVEIMDSPVAFTTDLATTAAGIAANINTKTSTPDYSATSDGAVITITADDTGMYQNGFTVVVTSTTITTEATDMAGGSDALIESSDNEWDFDYQYDSSSEANYIIAHVAPNLGIANNDEGGQIFYGSVTGTDPLTSIQLPSGANCTGGVVALHPYLMYYGTAGIIGWSKPGEPTNLIALDEGAGVARVWGQKIVKGLPLRGSAPSGIFWAWDAVIRATFVGSPTYWQFDVVASDCSIISANAVVDYDGVFYWAGVDRFLMYNGVVREVPNQLNLNWFFDGLNKDQQSKVFAVKVPRYGEIWWCYPRGEATECSHAVVYNTRENTWYDTELPANGRTNGVHNNLFAAPIMTGAYEQNGNYLVWLHEQGVDEINGSHIEPILSYFETADISSVAQGSNQWIRVNRVEPDFIQKGPMTLQVTGRANPRASEVYSEMFSFPAHADNVQQQTVMLKEQRRELRFRFESNAVGGDYQMGQIIGHIGPSDRTILGG